MSREQFEAWWEINYHNGNPPRFGWAAYREDGGYKIDDDESELDGMWQAWQEATKQTEAKYAALAAELESKQKDLEECAMDKVELSGSLTFTTLHYEAREIELNNALCELLPGAQYMDPPDGGSVTPLEQVRRMVADYRERIAELEQRHHIKPCPKCNGTGMVDSGGTQPWGDPIEIECDCRQQDANTAELVAAGIVTKVGE